MTDTTRPSLVESSFPDDTLENVCVQLALLAAGLNSPPEVRWSEFDEAAIRTLGEIHSALKWELEHARPWASPQFDEGV